MPGELLAAERRNCSTSGFAASAPPSGNYGLDVHIDSGLFGLGAGAIMSAIQDLLVQPLWMGLVWALHALVVMLEWCFRLDLLGTVAAGGLLGGLRVSERQLTEPWLPLALAVAGTLAAYHGLVRRRVAGAVGEAVLALAMMALALWLIADPGGTVGAVAGWADEASLGTLAAAAQGDPARPERALASDLDGVYSAAIEAPWCFLEFGDVGWCEDPARLDPRLRRAALAIAADAPSAPGCPGADARLLPCPGGSAPGAASRSAKLLRQARTNGAIFLALPANGPGRNSINDGGSLLRVLCGSDQATNCRGPTAPQAEFRTQGSTSTRLGGLALIAAGLLGMLLLLGFLALRLLTAAIISLLCLLAAPAVVLAPAFGEAGRSLFRRWGGRLLESLLAKLLFSFALGAAIAVLRVLSQLTVLGWWAQWLLISALWWGTFLRRHEALGLMTPGARPGTAGHWRGAGAPLRRVGTLTPLVLARRARGRQATPAPPDEGGFQAAVRRLREAAAARRAVHPDAAEIEDDGRWDGPDPGAPADHEYPPYVPLASPPEYNPPPTTSRVLQDVFEVQAGRKRELGFGRE